MRILDVLILAVLIVTVMSEPCSVPPSERTNCGYPGITKEKCESKGCCFDNSIKDTIWCFLKAKDYRIKSSILADNAFYQSRLHQFLTPAVGSHPQWVLCYRASSHGWAASTFHSRCDGKRDTVTIIKKGQYVFGGYVDIPWDSSSGWSYTSNAFIFSLCNKEGLGPFKSMVKKPQFAIFRSSRYGPLFGDGHDIVIANNANSNTKSFAYFGDSYAVPSGVQDRATILAGSFWFTPDEVEVFYLG